MITKQEIKFENDGTIRVRNTADFQDAVEQAKYYDEIGMGNGKHGYMMGVIPEEMYLFDPWLKLAFQHKREGDNAKYTEYMLKFFKVHSAFRVNQRKTMFNGYCVPMISNKSETKKDPDMERFMRTV